MSSKFSKFCIFSKKFRNFNFSNLSILLHPKVGCNIPEKIFQVSIYFITFDIPALCNGDIWPKIRFWGTSGKPKWQNPKKCQFFSWTVFTFDPISQLSDVLTSKFEVLRHRESKSFPARPSRARKNEY